MQDGCFRRHGGDWIEHRRQDLVGDVEQPASPLGGGFSFGDDRSDVLADEPHHIVEHVVSSGSTRWSSWVAVL